MARNRQQILNSFDIDKHGIITSPGKFEGNMLYVPFFYDLWIEGWADDEGYDDNIPFAIFYITDEDIEHFPELRGIKRIEMWKDEYGFVQTYEK